MCKIVLCLSAVLFFNSTLLASGLFIPPRPPVKKPATTKPTDGKPSATETETKK